jgi:hypothetical protein
LKGDYKMRVLVCGGRNWRDIIAIERELKKLPKDTLIIHGAARGADTLAKFVAEKIGLKVINDGKGFPAQWKIYGKAAGPIRNQQMLDEGKPDLVLAFHENISESRGTKDMVNRARGAGVKVEIFQK